MDLTIVGIIGIIAMVVLIFAGMNIGLSMFFVGFLGYAFCVNTKAAVGVLMSQPMSTAMNYTMTVMPMFILMGQFIFYAGLSEGLFDAAEKWFGRVRGGLGMATIAACALFGAICGSMPASIVTMAAVAYPEMKKRRYDDSLSAGALCSGSTLGCLIPPSSTLILYGIITETPIGKLFAAGAMPGVVMAIMFIITVAVMVKRDPSLAPEGQSFSWKEKFISLKGCVLTVVLFVIVIGGLFAGWFSATEAAAIGAVAALVLMIVKRQFTLKRLKDCLWATVKATCMSMMIMLGANMLGYFLAITNLPQALANAVSALTLPHAVTMAIIIVVYALLGCIMDGLALTILTVPIMLPVVNSLGFGTVWFGVIMTMVMNLGAITPPVGTGAYITSGALKVPLEKVFKGAVPFVIAFAVSFLLVIIFPQIIEWLPTLLFKSIE